MHLFFKYCISAKLRVRDASAKKLVYQKNVVPRGVKKQIALYAELYDKIIAIDGGKGASHL
jgi:hypothetical protein